MFGVQLSYLGTAIDLFWQNTSCKLKKNDNNFFYFSPFLTFLKCARQLISWCWVTFVDHLGIGLSIVIHICHISTPRQCTLRIVCFCRGQVTGLFPSKLACTNMNLRTFLSAFWGKYIECAFVLISLNDVVNLLIPLQKHYFFFSHAKYWSGIVPYFDNPRTGTSCFILLRGRQNRGGWVGWWGSYCPSLAFLLRMPCCPVIPCKCIASRETASQSWQYRYQDMTLFWSNGMILITFLVKKSVTFLPLKCGSCATFWRHVESQMRIGSFRTVTNHKHDLTMTSSHFAFQVARRDRFVFVLRPWRGIFVR
jgi:hypothetical protein